VLIAVDAEPGLATCLPELTEHLSTRPQQKVDADFLAPQPAKATNVFKKGCPECGSASRHNNSCSRPPRDKEPQHEGNSEWQRLDGPGRGKTVARDVFDRAKLSQTHDIPSDVIARELKLTLKQVNLIFLARDYDAYVA
jgi:hypothetical protein